MSPIIETFMDMAETGQPAYMEMRDGTMLHCESVESVVVIDREPVVEVFVDGDSRYYRLQEVVDIEPL